MFLVLAIYGNSRGVKWGLVWKERRRHEREDEWNKPECFPNVHMHLLFILARFPLTLSFYSIWNPTQSDIILWVNPSECTFTFVEKVSISLPALSSLSSEHTIG